MLTLFQKHIKTHFPKLFNQQVGVAISGGVDSVVLAYLLYKSGISITLLHCNFNLRSTASDEDQNFVEQLATTWNTPFTTIGFNTLNYAKIHKLSIQVAARELRYQWFTKMSHSHNLNAVATAHHADDNLETFLINLTRGTGLEGLTGIPQKNGLYIRPLLPFSKQQITNYAEKQQLLWREDASNLDTKYLRNKIRHLITPVLKEIQPQILPNVNQTINYLQQSQSLVVSYVKDKQKEYFELDNKTGFQKIIVNTLLEEPHLDLVLFESLKPYGFTAWLDIKNLLQAQTGKKVISPTHTLLRNRNHLLLYTNVTSEKNTEFIIQETEKEAHFSAGTLYLKNENTSIKFDDSNLNIYIDKKKISYPLIVRKWQKGDYFYPSGMQGKKKLSKYFKDEKYALPEKNNTWLLCSNNEIIWVIGKRVDRRFLATSKTINSIKIVYETNN